MPTLAPTSANKQTNQKEMSSRSKTKCQTKCLHLLILLVLFGVKAECRPIERLPRSAEEILAGVDFLSILINAAENQSHDYQISTIYPPDCTESSSASKLTDVATENIIDEKNVSGIVIPVNLIPADTIPVTILSVERSTEIHKSSGFREEMIAEDSKMILTVNTPIAVTAESKNNLFNLEETDPFSYVAVNSNSNTKMKRKTEDAIPSGANPDYIAQQHARIHGIGPYQPYNRNPGSTRSRAASYTPDVQNLPHDVSGKSWSLDEKSIDGKQQMNTPLFNSKDYGTSSSSHYDYTETYPDYRENLENKTTSLFIGNRDLESVAESKEYFAARNYNPEELNDNDNKQGDVKSRTKLSLGQISINKQRDQNWEILEQSYGIPESELQNKPTVYGRPEENYEVDESISISTNGRAHGIQRDSHLNEEKPLAMKVSQSSVELNDNQKIGYVVEGRNYRKYRVEERTSDGFIVGEYGVVRNGDGNLRGVRYTADGTTNPRLIYNALMKFLSL